MQLLVSVRDETEAAEALAAGADVIDAKDPAAGPLGRVPLDVFQAIVHRVGHSRAVSAALGDASGEQDTAHDAAAFVSAGAAFVKIGFAGIADIERVEDLIAAAGRAANGHVVAVAYADHRYAETASPRAVLGAAIRAGAAGILIDTADKRGPGLRALIPDDALRRIVAAARAAGLLTALAGQLTAEDLLRVRDSGADIAGVRGAACEGGRSGRINGDRIARLLRRLRPHTADMMNSSAATIAGTMPGGTA